MGKVRGRPTVFKGLEKKHILSVVRKLGLTKGREALAKEKISISLPTLGKFAAEAGIELQRGRPLGEGKVAKPAKKGKKAKAKAKAKAMKKKIKVKAKKVANVVVVGAVPVAAPVEVVEVAAPVVAEAPVVEGAEVEVLI